MIKFTNRTKSEQDIIRKAYQFEMEAIENCDSTTNPYFHIIKAMEDGENVWEAINVAVEMAVNS